MPLATASLIGVVFKVYAHQLPLHIHGWKEGSHPTMFPLLALLFTCLVCKLCRNKKRARASAAAAGDCGSGAAGEDA